MAFNAPKGSPSDYGQNQVTIECLHGFPTVELNGRSISFHILYKYESWQ